MSNIRINQIKTILDNAISNRVLLIEYSKAKCFAEAFEREAKKGDKSRIEIKDFEMKNIITKLRGKCSISSKDFAIIEKIITS